MALIANRPGFTLAQQALQASCDITSVCYNQLKGQFEAQSALFPGSGTNQFGFTQSQMLSGLGADQAEFVAAWKAVLVAISILMPSFPGDTWARKTNIFPFWAQLGVTIPTGF